MTSEGFRKLLLVTFVIDILFLPFLLPIQAPLSIFVFPIWLLLARKRVPIEHHFLLFAGALIALGTYASSLFDAVHFEAFNLAKFNNTALLVFMLLSFAMLDDLRHNNLKTIYILLQAYMVFILILSVLFIIDPYIYFDLRGLWTFSDSELAVGSISIITRCTGILSDPNNHAVSTCAIGALLIALNRRKVGLNLAIVFACLIIVTTTMSATGFICLAILAAYFFSASRVANSTASDLAAKTLLFIVFLICLSVVFGLMEDNAVVRLAFERLELSDVDSRFDRWSIIFDIEKVFGSLLLGDGGAIYWDDRMYLPHNGHFHVFFAFGGLVYIIFVVKLFNIRKWSMWRDAAFLVILIAGFTVNVGIYEHRFAAIWILLLCAFYESANVDLPRRRAVQKFTRPYVREIA